MNSLYHSSKSNVLKRLSTCNYESVTDSKTNDSAIIIDLLFFTKSHAINENTTFLEFSDSLRKVILIESSSCLRRKVILIESSSCLRCDIADLYFQNHLNQNIWSSRGLGSRKHFNDKTNIPGL